jgi:endonuclease/exonuclease/phosphatase (EEP) superfamily protein YafD
MRGFGFAIAVIAMLLTLGSVALDSVWIFDVLASLRVQAVIGSAALALLALIFRKWYAGGLLAACAAVNIGLMMPSVLREMPASSPAPKNELSMLFYNSAQNTLELAPLLAFVKQKQPDLLAFTEVHRWDIKNLRQVFPGYRHTIGEPGVFGAVILSKVPIHDFRVHRHADGPSGRTLEVRFCSPSETDACIALLVLHPTPPLSSDFHGWRNAHLMAAAEQARLTAEEASISGRVIMAGDFNVTPWNTSYLAALDAGNLHDAFGSMPLRSTWFSSSPVLGLSLDHIWTGPDVWPHSGEVGPLSGSDHLPIYTEMTLGFRIRP